MASASIGGREERLSRWELLGEEDRRDGVGLTERAEGRELLELVLAWKLFGAVVELGRDLKLENERRSSRYVILANQNHSNVRLAVNAVESLSSLSTATMRRTTTTRKTTYGSLVYYTAQSSIPTALLDPRASLSPTPSTTSTTLRPLLPSHQTQLQLPLHPSRRSIPIR